MAIEIERKFLVKGDFRLYATHHYRMVQGYICPDKGRTVRVRLCDNKGFLTIKGPSMDDGPSRYEFEKEISVDESLSLLRLCSSGIIDKTRWLVPYQGHTFEVDEFRGDNEGLIIAEIELSSANEIFEKPDWLGEEITGDRRYYNSALSIHPFCTWK